MIHADEHVEALRMRVENPSAACCVAVQGEVYAAVNPLQRSNVSAPETFEFSGFHDISAKKNDSEGNKNPADEDTLTAQATARLKELQADGSVEINIAETLNAHVGALVAAHSVNIAASVTGTVNKLILNINDKGTATISYEVGTLVSEEEEIA